ncbi:MAG: 30S ribosomal protein S8 [Candidatus Sungbacteria bacterium]|nr:30S ribosomal protein S8 [Candidatus Sungbacteria bacterium]
MTPMDPISDFLNQIKNAYRARKASVVVPYSKIKDQIAGVLEDKGYIAAKEKKGRKVRKFLEIKLRYDGNGPAMAHIKRVSKPSRRLYVGKDDIRPVRQGFGISIVSTSKGIMAGDNARKLGLGGEMIAEVW